MTRLLDVESAARLLNAPIGVVARLVARGALPSIGGRVCIDDVFASLLSDENDRGVFCPSDVEERRARAQPRVRRE